MVDNMSKKQRSKTMMAVKSVSKLESIISNALWKEGFRFRRNTSDLFGKPDISIKKYKIVIFIDSCFWHKCPLHANLPKSNIEYWERKLNRNAERDIEVNNYYKKKGWHLKRVWEHDIKDNLDKVIEELSDFIIDAKRKETT